MLTPVTKRAAGKWIPWCHARPLGPTARTTVDTTAYPAYPAYSLCSLRLAAISTEPGPTKKNLETHSLSINIDDTRHRKAQQGTV